MVDRDSALRLEPPAPVSGGMRWRDRNLDIINSLRRVRGVRPIDPDAPVGGAVYVPESGTLAPNILSVPPPEAGSGEEYVYHARAYDGIADGFTWYFEECPPGMTVDRHSGEVRWTPSEGGHARVVLCARSVYGAFSRQCWTLCVRKAATIRPSTTNLRFRSALRWKATRTTAPRLPLPWKNPVNPVAAARRSTAPPTARPPPTPTLRL